MKSFFTDLFNYNHFVNQQMIQQLIDHEGKVSDRSVLLLNHILNANHIWNHRIQELIPTLKVWDVNPAAQLKDIDRSNFELSCKIVENSDHEKVITYTNSKGETYPNKVKEILFHVINHSTYHRAQIASDLKYIGITPIVTDYIAYKR